MKIAIFKILFILFSISLLTGVFYYNKVLDEHRQAIVELGYTTGEIDSFIDQYGLMEYRDIISSNLERAIEEKQNVVVNYIGLPVEEAAQGELTDVEYNLYLDQFINENTMRINGEIADYDAKLAALAAPDENVYEGATLSHIALAKNDLYIARNEEVNAQFDKLVTDLREVGLRESDLQTFISGDVMTDIGVLNEKLDYYKKFGAGIGAGGTSYASGSKELFDILNAHRISKGLPAFTYRSDQQACVDMETVAYAQNKNPHNWLCKSLTSEGSSLASSSSDYIGIAGRFLTTHASHEADVINPRYTGSVCSVVNKGSMNYMVCGYFQ